MVNCGCGASGANYLCKDCLKKFTRWIDDLLGVTKPAHHSLELLAELSVTASRQDRLFGSGPALYAASAEIPAAPPQKLPPYLRSKDGVIALPSTRWQFGWDAAMLLEDAHSTLHALAREIANHGHLLHVVLPLSSFFAAHLAKIVTMPDASQWFDDVAWLHGAAMIAIDRREPDQFAGRCTEFDALIVNLGAPLGPICGPFEDACEHESCTVIREAKPDRIYRPGLCGTDLYYRAEDAEVRCPKCGMVYNVHEMKMKMITSIDDQIDTTTVIANALTGLMQVVTPSMIRQMAHRGQVSSRGLAADGVSSTYRVGDVVRVLDARRERELARRRGA